MSRHLAVRISRGPRIARGGRVSGDLGLKHFEAGLSFALPKAADSDECGKLLLAGARFALLPVVNRNLVNADKERVVGLSRSPLKLRRPGQRTT